MKKFHVSFAGLSLWILAAFLLQSCTPAKKVIYANDLTPAEGVANLDQITIVHKIQIGDLLQVRVAALDNAEVEVFNPLMQGGAMGGGAMMGAGGARGIGYKVNPQGQVDIPLVGPVAVAGLTTEEAAQRIQQGVAKFIVDPFVNVAVLSFRVSVLGAVRSPGTVNSMNDRLTILDAMAQSGDMLPTGVRDRVWVIRESNGQRQYAQVDLTSKNLFDSEYYYLRNNDIVYVQPNKSSALFGSNAPFFSLFGALAGIAGLIIALIN